MITSSSSSGSQNMAFISTPGSTNEVDTATIQVSTVSTPVSTVSAHDNTANQSDATVYAFHANQPNGSQLRIGKKIIINRSDTAGYDKTKVECFNFHKMGHFARECRSPRSQESFDWSYIAYDEVLTNMALMAFSDSEVSDCDEDKSEEMVVKSKNVQHKPENFAPTAVLTKSGIVPISTARQRSSKAASPVSTARPINTAAPKPIVNVIKTRQNAFQKTHSLPKRPFHQQTVLKNRYLVNTAKVKSVNTAKRKSMTSVVGKQGTNAVKSLVCWVWRPKIKVQDHVSKNSRSYICKRFDYVDPEGRLNRCPWHMTGNKSFLSDYQEYDGGFIAFASSFKRGKITGKGKIRTGKLDFKDVYYVKELKYNLFSVSQMCDKKNSVLFIETECLVLSPDFKRPDENQILLKVPRKNNTYSFDLKNVVTFLYAKATNDESNLWHRRLGHINFKTMNKLVKENLVRGLKIHSDAGQEGKEKVSDQEYILLPVLNTSSYVPSSNEEVVSSPKDDAGKKSILEPTCVEGGKIDDGTFQRTYGEWNFSTPITVNAVGSSFSHPAALDDFSKMPNLEDTRIFDDAYNDRDEGMEPKKVTQALDDESWVEAMQEELLQFKLLNVWTQVVLPHGKRGIETKWVYRNKKDQRGIVVRNKARLVAQGHRQEEGIDHDEVYAHVARIEAIRLFLAYASFMDFTVYQMDVKSIFLYGTIKEEYYVSQPPGFVDLEFPNRVYKTKIHVDNESAIYVVKNPFYHSKTKHIEIRHYFIRDSYEKRLIEMVKIHIDSNVADLLTKAFDVTRF
nr:copia protein [Tanacetum cinerariifolium]